MWRILQQDQPGDYVLATGESHSVREFVELAFTHVERPVAWHGTGVGEQGLDARTGEVLVEIDPRYFRPAEVDHLRGNPAKAARLLGWKHTTSFPDLVRDMVEADLVTVKQELERRDPTD